MRELIIGTRGSALATWQARWVAERLVEKVPGLRVRIETVKTAGDVANQAPLWEIGGAGLFVRELERALKVGQVDVAVHSMKDLPSTTADELVVAAVPEREDPRDVLVARQGLRLENLPEGAKVGTSSTRRRAQLLAYRPDLQIVPLRGNVDTRLRKVEEGGMDAIVLAAAGLARLGKLDRAAEYLPVEICLPAVGQGALAIQVRRDDVEATEILSALEHLPTRAAIEAERSFLRALGGGCQLPIAALCTFNGPNLVLDGLVAKPDGTKVIRGRMAGASSEAEALGYRLFHELEPQGTAGLLAEAAR